MLGGLLTLKGNFSYSVSLVVAVEMKHASTLPLTCYYFKIFCLNFGFLILKEIIINKKTCSGSKSEARQVLIRHRIAMLTKCLLLLYLNLVSLI